MSIELTDRPARSGHAVDLGDAEVFERLTHVEPAEMPGDADELRQLADHGDLDDWRRLFALVAANPWGPDAGRLAGLARDAGLTGLDDAFGQCAELYRQRHEESERLEVAKEIRRLVAISGCSQRQFAQYVGTSPSRLSTYVNGLVTPSAAMMLRITRAAHALAPDAPSVRA